jgi:hypothetical protein
MQAKWFKKRGYQVVDKIGIQALLWKPFHEGAVVPKLIRQKKKPEKVAGQVTVCAFKNGWCPASNIVFERAKRASHELGEKIEFIEYDTTKRDIFSEWGVMDALFIDGKEVQTGPPPSYDKIYKLIEKKVKKLK